MVPDGGIVEGDHLRVLVGHAGQQIAIPFEGTTTAQTALGILLEKFPLPTGFAIADFGLFLGNGTLLEPTKEFSTYQLSETVFIFVFSFLFTYFPNLGYV